MIELMGLTKACRGFLALDDVTLRIPGGVVVGYVGPNGAGKPPPSASWSALCGRRAVTVAELTRRTLRRIDLLFAAAPPDLSGLRHLPGIRRIHQNSHRVQIEVEGSTAELLKAIAPYDVVDIVSREPDLEEVFLGYYGQD